ncbi:unnamed protein product [Symbiodinium pilosum]|uniref:Uncharacterized protein n=1 Tax=Symbiodinium pilosum TaxID=2952 RepID=A0A812RHQ5_SYMPI|nr:unnamed protein product [Symbiodinium pilosum]
MARTIRHSCLCAGLDMLRTRAVASTAGRLKLSRQWHLSFFIQVVCGEPTCLM